MIFYIIVKPNRNIMKKLKLFTLGIACSFCFSFLAQSQITPEQRAEKMTRDLSAELGLSAEQVQKIKPINLEVANKYDEIIKNGVEANRPFISQVETKYKGILTSQQFEKFTAMEQETLKKMETEHTNNSIKQSSLQQSQATPAVKRVNVQPKAAEIKKIELQKPN
jgi:hypothetical protein